MIPRYPEGLPCPLREGYEFTPVNNIVRTDMQSGRARQRVEFTNTPTMLRLTWLCTPEQAQLLEAWAVQVVGANWFELQILSSLGFDSETVRFTETIGGPALTGQRLWKYTALVELKRKPILPPDWTLLPDFVLNPEIFDYAINREWPEYVPGNLLTQSGDILITESGDRLILE